MFSIFSAQFSSLINGFAMIAIWVGGGECCGWLGDENHDRKNRTDVFNFFCRDFRHRISPINSFENFKFSKMLDEDTISRIRGSCDCDGENWVTKITAKKMKNVSSIFSAAIFVTQLLPSQLLDPRIHDIASSSNIFENLKFSKMFDEDAILQIRGSCDWDGRGSG